MNPRVCPAPPTRRDDARPCRCTPLLAQAVHAIGMLDKERMATHAPKVAQRLRDASAAVRSAALHRMRRRPSIARVAAPPLQCVAALPHTCPLWQVRSAAISTLGKLDPAELSHVAGHVAESFQDVDKSVRAAAVEALLGKLDFAQLEAHVTI